MGEETKWWWVSYVVAQLSVFVNVGGYIYSWESSGNNTSTNDGDLTKKCDRCGDYELAELLHEMDPFHHATTYEAENVTVSNHFDLSVWTFASVEALGANEHPRAPFKGRF